jgi:hypothetical protein
MAEASISQATKALGITLAAVMATALAKAAQEHQSEILAQAVKFEQLAMGVIVQAINDNLDMSNEFGLKGRVQNTIIAAGAQITRAIGTAQPALLQTGITWLGSQAQEWANRA